MLYKLFIQKEMFLRLAARLTPCLLDFGLDVHTAAVGAAPLGVPAAERAAAAPSLVDACWSIAGVLQETLANQLPSAVGLVQALQHLLRAAGGGAATEGPAEDGVEAVRLRVSWSRVEWKHADCVRLS